MSQTVHLIEWSEPANRGGYRVKWREERWKSDKTGKREIECVCVYLCVVVFIHNMLSQKGSMIVIFVYAL